MFKYIDCHVHIHQNKGMKALTTIAEEEIEFGHYSYNVLSLEGVGKGFRDQNAICLANKREHPDTYVFCGLNHAVGDFRKQAEALWECGCDGFKMIEGKPDAWNRLKIRLDDASYDGFYSFCCEKNLPILMHIADPKEFWDITKMKQHEIERGWFYNDTFPTKEYLTEQALSVLEKFPDLKVIFAHFFFHSEYLPKMAEYFDKYPNMYTDITPGVEMYPNFSSTQSESIEFFNKYKTRILYGTDTGDFVPGNGRKYMQSVVTAVRRFLDTDDDMTDWEYIFKGAKLSDEVRELIYSGNFLRITDHREINAERATEFFRDLIANPNADLNDAELENIKTLWNI